MAMIEKSVERCALIVSPSEGTVTFKLHCHHGKTLGGHKNDEFGRGSSARPFPFSCAVTPLLNFHAFPSVSC